MTGGRIFNADGDFADAGKPLLTVKTRYEDGDSVLTTFAVGIHARNWLTGLPYACGADRPYYVLTPTDPLVAEVLSDPTYHYDLQKIQLPAAKRNKRVSAVEFLAQPILRSGFCVAYYGTSALCGLATWPKFEIKNRLGQDLPFYSQGGNQPYGGYVIGDSLYGARKDLSANGCLLSCYAMALKYYGLDYTPATLNTYLQNTRGGYVRAPSGVISSVSGFDVTF